MTDVQLTVEEMRDKLTKTKAALTDAILWGADLRGVRMSGAILTDATFRGADLRGASMWFVTLPSDLDGADLRGFVVFPADDG